LIAVKWVVAVLVFLLSKAKLMTIECKKKDAAIILIVVGCVAVIVS